MLGLGRKSGLGYGQIWFAVKNTVSVRFRDWVRFGFKIKLRDLFSW